MGRRLRRWRAVQQHAKTIRDRHHWLRVFYAKIAGARPSGFFFSAATKSFDSDIPYDVFHAVEVQLTLDKRRQPHNQDWAMEDDYGYDVGSMDGFLAAVGLQLHKKGHTFAYDAPFVQKALKAKLIDLKVDITKKTT